MPDCSLVPVDICGPNVAFPHVGVLPVLFLRNLEVLGWPLKNFSNSPGLLEDNCFVFFFKNHTTCVLDYIFKIWNVCVVFMLLFDKFGNLKSLRVDIQQLIYYVPFACILCFRLLFVRFQNCSKPSRSILSCCSAIFVSMTDLVCGITHSCHVAMATWEFIRTKCPNLFFLFYLYYISLYWY